MHSLSLPALALGALAFSIPTARTALISISKPPDEATATSSRGIETQRFDDGSVLKVDTTGKGAVLCIWGIYQAIRAVGQECYKGHDAAFQAELDRSLDRIDTFIIRNSMPRMTKADLAARRAAGLEELHASENICKGSALRMYGAIRDQGPAALHANTKNLLSVPREPVMAPCL